GVHAMLLAAARRDRALALPRFSHLSAYTGLALADLEPHFAPNRYDVERQLWLPPAADAWPNLPAPRLVQHPTYYGLADPAADAGGADRLVDEAWGPHLPFAPCGVPPAVGAVRVQSAHKLLNALTQAAWLLIDDASWLAPIDWALTLLASTSPSPLLLASLDAATAELGAHGAADWSALCERLEEMHAVLAQAGIPLWGGLCEPPAGLAFDRTRLVVETAAFGWDGFDAAAWLRKRQRLQVEMADFARVVLIATPADDAAALAALAAALVKLKEAAPPRPPRRLPEPPAARQVVRPRAALGAQVRAVPLAEATGRIAAEWVCPYPPGVPVIAPGQDVSRASVEYLTRIRAERVPVRGCADPALGALLIMDE
ncbi:MAG TPA: hypothetical protein VFK80_05125, partial [Limnochordia bacterium]|nr:hypothetical protein [Limnochordia bacterium]